MHYYPFNISDYASHTRHLTNMEDLAFRRLLDFYYLHEEPIENDVKKVARKLNLRGNENEIQEVLEEFFFLENNTWLNKRAEEIIKAYQAKADTARANGKKGGRPAKPKGNPEETKQEPNRNPEKTQLVNSANPEETGLKPDRKLTNNYKLRTKELITNNQEQITSNQELVTKDSLSIDIDPVKTKSIEVLNYLNECLGTKYKSTTRSHIENINARLQDHDVEDLKLVVNHKIKEWGDDERMVGYLRPSTLFQTSKFDGYLMAAKAAPVIQQSQNQYSKTTQKNIANTEGWGD